MAGYYYVFQKPKVAQIDVYTDDNVYLSNQLHQLE